MDRSILLTGILALLALWFFTGCTSTGRATRFDPRTSCKEDSWYIEGQVPAAGEQTNLISCSFIEFDGRGDYLDFRQYEDAWHRIREIGSKEKLLLVIYCHGWKNNAHSGDVVKFNEFLAKLAASPAVADYGYRVHGVYLSWQGNLYHPYVDTKSEDSAYHRTAKIFGEPIVDRDRHRRWKWTAFIQENVSYWSRRRAAEYKVSSVPVARAIYSCASLAKKMDLERSKASGVADDGGGKSAADPTAGDLMNSSRVMVLGHSFGALLLERALYSTCLDPLIDQWAWFQQGEEPAPSAEMNKNPLPLDFVLFVNSAAPAIYAKTMRDFLTAHRSALAHSGSILSNTPIFISLTSSADKATRYAHPVGNLLARFSPSLQREYKDLLKVPRERKRRFHQSVFYNRTPGHQPLLIDHWIVRDETDNLHQGFSRQQIINANLDYECPDPLSFLAVPAGQEDAQAARWKFSLSPPSTDPDEQEWAGQHGPLHHVKSAYWIVRTDKNLIRDHNDIWSDTAMEVYAGLYRLVEWTRVPANPVEEVFERYWSSRKRTAGLAEEDE